MKYRVLSYSLLLLLILNSCNNNSGSTENPAVVAKDTTVISPSPLDAVPQKIGLIVPALLILGNKHFGLSANLRHACAACFPANLQFFQYAWKKEVVEK